jgi:hypothetical protein
MPKDLGGDLEGLGRGLLALVLGALDEAHYLFDDRARENRMQRRSARGFVALDVGFEDGIENLVGRQRIGVLLIWPQLGRGGLVRMASGMISPLRLTQRLRRRRAS